MTDDLAPDLEEFVSFTPSPLAKFIVVGTVCLLGGVVIGLGVSALLKEIDSEAPRIPTRVHEEKTLSDYEIITSLNEDRPVEKADLEVDTTEKE